MSTAGHGACLSDEQALTVCVWRGFLAESNFGKQRCEPDSSSLKSDLWRGSDPVCCELLRYYRFEAGDPDKNFLESVDLRRESGNAPGSLNEGAGRCFFSAPPFLD
jgi:hypothetical protein